MVGLACGRVKLPSAAIQSLPGACVLSGPKLAAECLWKPLGDLQVWGQAVPEVQWLDQPVQPVNVDAQRQLPAMGHPDASQSGSWQEDLRWLWGIS